MLASDYLKSGPPFSLDDAHLAADQWGFNCGPAAIASVVRLTLDELRPHMLDFERKGYTNPTLMFDVLRKLGVTWKVIQNSLWPAYGLVRIQWHGPWMNEGVPIKARYRKTHWIGARQILDYAEVFDVNCMCVGGWVPRSEWVEQVVPWIIRECVPRGNGEFSATHSLEVTNGIRVAEGQPPLEIPEVSRVSDRMVRREGGGD